MSPLRCTPSLLLSLSAAALPAQAAFRDAPIPRTAPVDDAKAFTVRIVDGRTGAAIAGAEVFAITEDEYPLPGELRWLERVVTDADGFATVPKVGYWTMARAPGYGPGMDMGQYDRVLPLLPGLDVPVRTRDWRGAPIPGCRVGWCCGCGHTPDLVNATTNADGIAVLPCIDPGNGISDLYLDRAPIEFTYDSVRWRPGDLPDEHRFAAGTVLHGRVLDAAGKPAQGAVVGNNDKHRGPWTAVDPDGWFALGGIQAGDTFVIAHAGRKIECNWPRELPCTLRLPAPNGEPWQQLDPLPGEGHARVRVQVRVAEGGAIDADDATVTLYGPRPRRCRWSVEPGEELVVPAGDYDVLILGPRMRPLHTALTAVDDDLVESALEVEPLPSTTLAVQGVPAGGDAVLFTADGRPQDLGGIGGAERERVYVDPNLDYCVHLYDGDGAQRDVPLPGWQLFADPLPVLRWFEPTRLRALLVDADGAATGADVALVTRLPFGGLDPRTIETTPCDGGDLRLDVTHAGAAWLWIAPRRAELRPRMVPVSLPARGDDVALDLGRVTLSPVSALRVLRADGSPVVGSAALLRTGHTDIREGRTEQVVLAPDGSWLGPDPVVGDDVLIEVAEPGAGDDDGAATRVRLPFRCHVAALPSVVREPTGTVHLTITDADGDALQGATVLLREAMWPAAGELTIDRIPAGAHRLFVGAAAHRTAVFEFTLAAGERRELQVRLPRR